MACLLLPGPPSVPDKQEAISEYLLNKCIWNEVNVFSQNSSILAWLEWSVYLGKRCKMFELKG